jgi:hypothetical protein
MNWPVRVYVLYAHMQASQIDDDDDDGDCDGDGDDEPAKNQKRSRRGVERDEKDITRARGCA